MRFHDGSHTSTLTPLADLRDAPASVPLQKLARDAAMARPVARLTLVERSRLRARVMQTSAHRRPIHLARIAGVAVVLMLAMGGVVGAALLRGVPVTEMAARIASGISRLSSSLRLLHTTSRSGIHKLPSDPPGSATLPERVQRTEPAIDAETSRAHPDLAAVASEAPVKDSAAGKSRVAGVAAATPMPDERLGPPPPGHRLALAQRADAAGVTNVPAPANSPGLRPPPAVMDSTPDPTPDPAPVLRQNEIAAGAASPLTPPPFAPKAAAAAAEAALLAPAISALRAHGDPQGAMVALDRYQSTFPAGVLAPEATRTRIQAHIALGQNDQALHLLRRLSTASPDLAVLRAELLADEKRWQEAKVDFDAVLLEATGPLRERALYGRVVCRARTGDLVGARADARRYLAEFPVGPHRGAIARALSGR